MIRLLAHVRAGTGPDSTATAQRLVSQALAESVRRDDPLVMVLRREG
ncbi:MAG: hypothetical protein ACRDZQ_08470 [Acidimicrobiales bacterium]